MSAVGIGHLHIIDGTLNVIKYIDTILEPKFLPSIRDLFTNNASFIFQQDSAHCHTVKPLYTEGAFNGLFDFSITSKATSGERDFSSQPETDESHLVRDHDCDTGAPNQQLRYGFALLSTSVDSHYHPTTERQICKAHVAFSESSPSISTGCHSTYSVALMVPTSKKSTRK
ncbi:transposable element Tcb1 transposase [Trichonephila clavipes]|uniref:Transposable element Tcb1 transposase n=1 Tax=Trichonephila clavipes TaxID=2585209 RepID=A0A8X6SK20_TRICX|nr:transposable element Tcb1 transposase [Trichonephila clavipes]